MRPRRYLWIGIAVLLLGGVLLPRSAAADTRCYPACPASGDVLKWTRENCTADGTADLATAAPQGAGASAYQGAPAWGSVSGVGAFLKGFAQGFWQGLKGQIAGLWYLITHPGVLKHIGQLALELAEHPTRVIHALERSMPELAQKVRDYLQAFACHPGEAGRGLGELLAAVLPTKLGEVKRLEALLRAVNGVETAAQAGQDLQRLAVLEHLQRALWAGVAKRQVQKILAGETDRLIVQGAGGALVFTARGGGPVEAQTVKALFQQLTGEKALPTLNQKVLSDGTLGSRYTVHTKYGNFNLRDYAKSNEPGKAMWTVGVPPKYVRNERSLLSG